MNLIKILLGFIVRKHCVAQVTAQFEKQLKMLAQIAAEQEVEKAKLLDSIDNLTLKVGAAENELQHARRVAERIKTLTE